ncbi:MAG: 50S ribosomal protein L18e [Candidatus Bathyarchaeia archaeon]
MRKIKETNPELIETILFLKKQSKESGTKIWRSVAELLAKSRRKRITVNISRLNRYAGKNEMVVVPGKVLGAGEIDHPVIVAAFAFTQNAREKIKKARGKCLSIIEFAKKNPKGSKVKIIG